MAVAGVDIFISLGAALAKHIIKVWLGTKSELGLK